MAKAESLAQTLAFPEDQLPAEASTAEESVLLLGRRMVWITFRKIDASVTDT
jgi:hypothetical protein